MLNRMPRVIPIDLEYKRRQETIEQKRANALAAAETNYQSHLEAAEKKRANALAAVETQYKSRLEDAERKKKEALKAIEVSFNNRMTKTSNWKKAEELFKLEASKPKSRMTKLDKEIEEAKQRQKEQFAKSKEEAERRKEANLPSVRDEQRAESFNLISSLLDGDSEDEKEDSDNDDMWDLSEMSHDCKISYLKSKIRQGEQPPEHLMTLLEEGGKILKISKKIQEIPPNSQFQKPAEAGQTVCLATLDFENDKQEEKSENSEKILENSPPEKAIETPQEKTIETPQEKAIVTPLPKTYIYTPPPLEEPQRPPILSNTKMKKPVKVALKR